MEGKQNRLHVLICEDDPDDQYLFECALLDCAHHPGVRFVPGSEQMIDYLCRCALSSSADRGLVFPDFIIADLKKPFFWLDGIRELRMFHQFSHIPLYAFSMSNDLALRNSVIGLGCTEFFQKPASYEQLRSIFRQILGSCPAPGAGRQLA